MNSLIQIEAGSKLLECAAGLCKGSAEIIRTKAEIHGDFGAEEVRLSLQSHLFCLRLQISGIH